MHGHVSGEGGHAGGRGHFGRRVRVQVVVGYRGLRRRVRRLLAGLVLALLGEVPDLVAQDPADGADGGQVELVAHAVGE